MNDTHEVIINSSAQKDIRKLPTQEVKKIVPAIRSLAYGPKTIRLQKTGQYKEHLPSSRRKLQDTLQH